MIRYRTHWNRVIRTIEHEHMTEITFNECVHVTRPNWFDIIRQWKHDLDATHIFFKIMRRTKNHFWEDSPCAPCRAPCRCSADPVLHQEVFVRGGLHQGIEKDFNCHVNRWQQQSNKAAMVRLCPQEAAAAGAAPSLALTKIGDVSSAWRKWQSMGFNLVILQLYKGL